MNTHETYVSLETDKLLKQAGFDWECRKIYYCYHEDGDTWELEDNYKNYKSILKLDHCLLTPTLDVAQRWLRENLNLIITVEYNEYNYQTFLCKVYSNEECLSILLDFPIYEEAQETGIKKALEIILEKGE